MCPVEGNSELSARMRASGALPAGTPWPRFAQERYSVSFTLKLVDLVRCKLRLKCRYYLLRSGVDRIVLLPHSKIKRATTVQRVCGHLIRDDFLGSRCGLADGAAHAPEYALHGLGLRSNVLVDGLQVGLGHHRFQSSRAPSGLYRR